MINFEKTIEALNTNGIATFVVESGEEAKQKVLDLIPKGANVMTMTSITLETIGLDDVLNGSEYKSGRAILHDESTSVAEKKIAGNIPEWVVGSVHGVTESGQVVVASGTGSQLPAYVYGAEHVVWVVGQQKFVDNLDSALKRINDDVIPLESVRARKAYGLPESWNTAVNKLLIINKEVIPGRITMIIVKENLGY